MTRFIAAAAVIIAAAAPTLACEWNKSVGAGLPINHRVSIRRSTA